MITAALCVLLLVPQPSRADGEKIVDVVVRGNRRIEASAILNVITAKPGDLLNSDRTDMDIRAIYRLGQFQDVQVSLEPVSGGVVLVYSVVEKPIVRDVRFIGNDKIKQEKLLEGLPVRRNAIFSQKDLDSAVAHLKNSTRMKVTIWQ